MVDQLCLTTFHHTCANCGNTQFEPTLPDQAYGELLIWADVGEVAVLSLINLVVFQDFRDQIREMTPNHMKETFVTIACDTSPTGQSYSLKGPKCKECGQRDHWLFDDALRGDMIEVGYATVETWSLLSAEVRREEIQKCLVYFSR